MEELSNLMNGVKIGEQHPYFDMAKRDIYKFAYAYSNFQHSDEIKLELYNELLTKEKDLYQLNIVIQYLITYGEQLFILYLKELNFINYNVNDYTQYLDEYVELLSKFIN
jgi:hypothetical protein